MDNAVCVFDLVSFCVQQLRNTEQTATTDQETVRHIPITRHGGTTTEESRPVEVGWRIKEPVDNVHRRQRIYCNIRTLRRGRAGTYKDNEKVIKVIAGKYEKAEGPDKNHNVEPIYFHIVLNKGKEFSCDVPESHNSFIYLLKGELKVGEQDHSKTGNSSLILLERGNKLIVKASITSEFLFIAGKPIGEPIARGGPFVMNTKAEILEAIQDYNNGTFAKY